MVRALLDRIGDDPELVGERSSRQRLRVLGSRAVDEAAAVGRGQELGQARDGVMAVGADRPLVGLAEHRVGTVLDQRDAAIVTELTYAGHRLGQSEIMGRDHRANPGEIPLREIGQPRRSGGVEREEQRMRPAATTGAIIVGQWYVGTSTRSPGPTPRSRSASAMAARPLLVYKTFG